MTFFTLFCANNDQTQESNIQNGLDWGKEGPTSYSFCELAQKTKILRNAQL